MSGAFEGCFLGLNGLSLTRPTIPSQKNHAHKILCFENTAYTLCSMKLLFGLFSERPKLQPRFATFSRISDESNLC